MIEQVTDASEVFKFLHDKIISMQQIIDTQYEMICQFNRNSEAQLKELKSLKQENIILRELLSKYEQPPKDSNNSSTPPSKENIKSETKRRTMSLREKSDRPIGGQVGHEGYTRNRVDSADQIVDHLSDYCKECGSSLSYIDSVLEYKTQEVDVPVIKPVITEHRHYSKVCTCGCRNYTSTPRPKGGNDIVFSKKIQALVVYYNIVQCVPYQRLQAMLKTIFGIQMSQGTISNLIQNAKEKAKPAIALIKEYISKSPIVGFDESGCYCQKRLDWSWIAQTPYCTLVFRENTRAGKVLDNMFGEALKNMIAVTDRHAAYFALDFKNHQICLAHILREVQYLNELDNTQQWSKELQRLLQEAIHNRNENPNKIIDALPWLTRLDNILKQNISHLKKEYHRLKNGLIKCRDFVFLFLENPAIPFDNNGSERGIRKLKIKQKISGTFRSENGADAFMDLHSVTDTAWKNKQSPFEAILAML